MRSLCAVLVLVCGSLVVSAQTADELIARNIQAKGGVDKIRAVNSIRLSGRFVQGNLTAQIGAEAKRPNMRRETFTFQGMTGIQAYDGKVGWQIQPFEGRKDPEKLGEIDLREIMQAADIDGPLVDYEKKGHKVEYLGIDKIDGDEVHRLKVTLKDGDILYYNLDPETALEIRIERQQFVQGDVREFVTDLGSYKPVAGVMYPFSRESGQKGSPNRNKITVEKIEVNVPLEDARFHFPTAPKQPNPVGTEPKAQTRS